MELIAYLDDDDIVSISCYDWSKEMETNDRFAISMWSELHILGDQKIKNNKYINSIVSI